MRTAVWVVKVVSKNNNFKMLPQPRAKHQLQLVCAFSLFSEKKQQQCFSIARTSHHSEAGSLTQHPFDVLS